MITATEVERVLGWLLGAVGHEVGVRTFGATYPQARADSSDWANSSQPGDVRQFSGSLPLAEFHGRLGNVNQTDDFFHLAIELSNRCWGCLRLDPTMLEDAEWYLITEDGERDVDASNPQGDTDWSGLTLLRLRLDGVEMEIEMISAAWLPEWRRWPRPRTADHHRLAPRRAPRARRAAGRSK
jgi:hypothetical protein